ncbi:hypothetical protein CN918_26340 [Priestia megaterium]|nr:hypothetical protein CN918_26340 [Priestia megaterium]
MLTKIYKVDMLTVDNQRITVHLAGNRIHDVVTQLKGSRLTFLPRGKEERHSFTLYAHIIAKMQYEPVADMGFNSILLYDVISD